MVDVDRCKANPPTPPLPKGEEGLFASESYEKPLHIPPLSKGELGELLGSQKLELLSTPPLPKGERGGISTGGRALSSLEGQTGFTIIELMITVAIAAILVAIAIPNMQVYTQNNRLRSTAYDLVAALNTARGEALKRKTTVVLCRTATDPTTTTPACGGTTKIWSNGWLVFVPSVSTSTTYTAATDVLLAKGVTPDTSVNVKTNSAAADNVVYNSDGTITAASKATLAVCDSRGVNFGKQVDVTPVGRPAITVAYPGTPLTTCTP